MDVEVTEIVPGEYDVHAADRTCRVLVPAGVGLPGVDDVELAGSLVRELHERGVDVPAVIDLATLLRDDPGLLAAVDARVERDHPDGPEQTGRSEA